MRMDSGDQMRGRWPRPLKARTAQGGTKDSPLVPPWQWCDRPLALATDEWEEGGGLYETAPPREAHAGPVGFLISPST